MQFITLWMPFIISMHKFDKEAGNHVEESKLRVSYVHPRRPPSPVPEESEEETSENTNVVSSFSLTSFRMETCVLFLAFLSYHLLSVFLLIPPYCHSQVSGGSFKQRTASSKVYSCIISFQTHISILSL